MEGSPFCLHLFSPVSLQCVTLHLCPTRFLDDLTCCPLWHFACHTDGDSCSEESDLTLLSQPLRSSFCFLWVDEVYLA